MPRMAADKTNKLATRDRAWAAMRELGDFTVPQIRNETRLGIDTIREYVTGLAAAGYIEDTGETVHVRGGVHSRVYRVRHPVRDTPRVRKDGTPVTQGRGRKQMWQTMRILGEFSARDLAVHASTEEHPVKEEEARDYAQYLDRAGYVVRVSGGDPGNPSRYRFLARQFTGPKPPQIQRVQQIYDPNLGRVVWREGEDGDD